MSLRPPACFTSLLPCLSPQGPKVRLHKATFSPLLPSELPQPGSLFALDAEFVAFAPAEKALRRWATGGGLARSAVVL